MSATKAELGSTEPKSSKSVFRNQDLNAALNMAKLAHQWLNEKKRDPAFCRETKLPSPTTMGSRATTVAQLPRGFHKSSLASPYQASPD
jgi:hypothetical protein